jgi:hypothetical protein
MLQAMIEAAPIPICVREAYVGDCEILMTYGTGHAIRRPWWLKHLAKAGRCVGWDLGYWRHEEGTMRMTLDADHPQRWIREEPASRWDAWGIELREDSAPDGPAVIVGLGQKALAVHRLAPLQWEQAAAARIAKKGRKLVFRPKRVADPRLRRVPLAIGPIEDVLRGASLVVCRHSNVAIDACIAGIPVICEDGAALALYRDGPEPTRDQRLQFLRGLAWWQWKPTEARDAWTYLLQRLSA